MSSQESQLQPLSLKQQDVNLVDPDMRRLFELLTWFRGDMRIVAIGNASIAANFTGQILTIQPPDNTEEWEVNYITMFDSIAVDQADIIKFEYGDLVLAQSTTLQISTLKTDPITTKTAVTFPNRDTIYPNLSIVTSVSDQGIILKRKDNKTPWLVINISAKTTATVGTRIFNAYAAIRRRRLI